VKLLDWNHTQERKQQVKASKENSVGHEKMKNVESLTCRKIRKLVQN